MLTGVLLKEKHSSFKVLDLNKQTKSDAYMRLYLTKKHPPENVGPENKLIALISFIFVLLLTTCCLFSS